MTNIATAGRVFLVAPGVPLQTAASSGGGGGSSGGSGGGGSSGAGPSGLANVTLIGGGQSNAGFAETSDGALMAMAQVAAFYLQATGTTAILTSWQNPGTPGTEFSGIGILEIDTPPNYGLAFLNNSAGSGYSATTAAAAGLGTCGENYSAYVAGLPSGQAAQILGIVFYWGETDSLEFGLGTKAVYKAACINWMAQVRAMIGQTIAELPVFWFGPPYGYTASAAMVREVWAELQAAGTYNCFWIAQQTYDSNTRGDSYNSSTGVSAATGSSNSGHRDAPDNLTIFKRAGLAAARAILASRDLAATLIPAALGNGIGPQISAVSISGATVTVTVTHDGGTALVMPSLSSPNGTDLPLPQQGVGFAVMDGGSLASPGSIIQATGCSIVDATHFTLTLASAPTSGAGQRMLFYPYPGETWADQPRTEIGRGCAITDNFATVAKPSGWDINAGLGSGYAPNMPIVPPMQISGGVASFGFAF